MKRFLTVLKKKIIENKWLLLLSIFYFIFRIINLTKLPIFNDESIYIDWGYREIHIPGYLYYSLYDAKQPLLMWAFGIFANIFSDPLFGARLVSVIAGFITFLGVYKLSKYLFSDKVGLASVLVYTLIPIFSFFDRQALMESSIAAVGIWSGYFFLKNLNVYKNNNSIVLGIILGIGFFIKSTSLIFLFSYLSLSFLLFFVSGNKSKNITSIIFALVSFLATVFLLLINPVFLQTFQTNSRYSLTFSEVLSFPFTVWLNNLFDNLNISFFYVTPLVFAASAIGIIKIFLEKKVSKTLFLLFFIIPFFINTILIRVPSDRYLVSFLPFLVILFSYFSLELVKKNRIFLLLFTICLLPAFLLTSFQVLNPSGYILFMGSKTSLNDLVYLEGQTSGYGISYAVYYFNNLSQKEKLAIGTGENTGNPESAMFALFNKNKNIVVSYLDAKLLGQNLANYDCISTGLPTYFVSRDEQLAGLDKFLQKLKTIKKPFDSSTIGIYKLIDSCKGKVLQLQIKSNT